MNDSVVIDTGFLISLSDKTRSAHETAKRYYKHFIENKITMLLPTVVVAEYFSKENVPELPLHNFRVLPFNYADACCCGALNAVREYKELKAGSRPAVKDDFKIIAQTHVSQAKHLLTEDRNTMAVYCSKLAQDSKVKFRVIPLSEPFDISFVNNDGQMHMSDEG